VTYRRAADISRHQGDVDMGRLSESVDELIMRCTLGHTGVDDRFAQYWRESGWEHIPIRAVYLLPIVELDARGHLANLRRVTGGDYGNGKIVIDVERRTLDRERMATGWRWPKEQFTDMILDLAFQLKRDSAGVRFYSNKTEWETMTTTPLDAKQFGFHVAGYPFLTPQTFESMAKMLGVYQPRLPSPWLTWEAWQCASTGRLPGIAGNVDLNFIRNGVVPVPPIDPAAARVLRSARAILAEVA
jgi:hypothetical protein